MNKLINNNTKEGVYIPSIQACWLYKENIETGNYEVDREYLDKLLVGKVDYSYELVANKALLNGITVHEHNGKLFTLDIINVMYDNRYRSQDEEKSTKELRDWSYIDGFTFNGNKMSNWKRSTGKARMGENLFILDDIVDDVLDWARIGLEFDDKIDIASVRSYESLPLSSIVGTIDIEPDSILVIDDYKSVFDWEMSKTELIDGELVTKLGNVEEVNDIYDGQGLMDKSIFDEYDLTREKGFALLRNRFFKCATFSANLSDYYKDYCAENDIDYDTFTLTDMFGNEILAKDVKLITTPNSIKIDKFTEQIRAIDGYDYEGSWLDYWLDNAGDTYGVCMVEKPSRFEEGKYNRLSYQMVNTIPFTRDEVTDLAEREVEYVERLKNDLGFFLHEVNIDTSDMAMLSDELSVQDEQLGVGHRLDVTGAFMELVKVNEDFAKTAVFKEYRRSFIASKVKDLRQGKIRVSGDYMYIVGNPIEMLKATLGQFDGKSITLYNNQVYCSRFADKECVVGFRNPHVCEGNVANLVNVNSKMINRYMNVTDNIVVTNNIDYPLPTLLQGQDQDGDTMLLTNEEVVVEASKRINHDITPIPVNAIANTGSNDTELTGANMSAIDHVISQNYIGEDINLSQELNSLFNHKINRNTLGDDERSMLYNKISKASSISCVEIDKAKRQFEDLSVVKELTKMKENMATVSEAHNLDVEDNRRVKPLFFKYIGDNRARAQRQLVNKKHKELLDEQVILDYAIDKDVSPDKVRKSDKELQKLLRANNAIQREWEDREYISMETPMDWIQESIDEIGRAKRMKTIQVIQLVKRNRNSQDEEIVSTVVDIITQTNREVKGYTLDTSLQYRNMKSKVDMVKKNASDKIRDMKITKADMYWVLRETLNSVRNNGKLRKRSGIESISLELLFMAHGTELLSMFKTK